MALPASMAQLCTHRYKPSQKMTFVYLNAATGTTGWKFSRSFPEVKTFHYVIDYGFSVKDFAEEFALPFRPCKPLPLLCCTLFCLCSFQFPLCWFHSFWFFSHHLVWTILISTSPFPWFPSQICYFFGTVSSKSLWHHTHSVCYLFSLLPTIFFHCPFYLAGYIYLVRKVSS